MTSIFVAKLDFGVDNQQLTSLFETFGKVNKASVALDRETGKSRGFGFVEMPDDGEAQDAIKNLDGHEINGRPIAVKQAEDRSNSRPTPRPSGDGPRRDSRPSDGTSAPSRGEFSRPGSDDDSAPSFTPEVGKEVRKKVPKSSVRENEGPKVKKMEAYRKSGKDNRFLGDDDDDFDEDIDLFGRDEDDDSDEDYSKYLVNASEDEEEDDEDYDEEDEEYDED